MRVLDGVVGQIASAEVPVHVVSIEAPVVARLGAALASATGGTCVDLHMPSADDIDVDHCEPLTKLLCVMRQLSRRQTAVVESLSMGADPTAVAKQAAVCRLQRAMRACLQRCRRRALICKRVVAVNRISQAYAKHRLRLCLAACASQARRARRREPVEAALRRRADLSYQASAGNAARRIQAEWRARRLRVWCQRVDRAARRLQGWCRQRWLRRKLFGTSGRLRIEARIRRRKEAERRRVLPPPPPSKRRMDGPKFGATAPSTFGEAEQCCAENEAREQAQAVADLASTTPLPGKFHQRPAPLPQSLQRGVAASSSSSPRLPILSPRGCGAGICCPPPAQSHRVSGAYALPGATRVGDAGEIAGVDCSNVISCADLNFTRRPDGFASVAGQYSVNDAPHGVLPHVRACKKQPPGPHLRHVAASRFGLRRGVSFPWIGDGI